MRYTDVVIIGGGLAGATTAAMLGRAGVATILIDPHAVAVPDFRCEKLGDDQFALYQKTGLSDALLNVTTVDREVWIGRFGYIVDKRPSENLGVHYHDLVNAVRAEIPASVRFIAAKAVAVATSDDRQRVTLSDGQEISARLVVIANGLNKGLRRTLGIESQVISASHSITIGFDLAPLGRPAFDFPAMTYYAERARDRMAYMTLFPIGASMRANLMVYRPIDDPWFTLMRETPEVALRKLMPRLERVTGDFKVIGPIRIRPADLYEAQGHVQRGIVLVGDAFATSCPAGGTGTDKVFTDVERLCHAYIPQWLSTPGMSVDKIAAYYADPVKSAVDARSKTKAFHLRKLSTSHGPTWLARRWLRFLLRLGQGVLRQLQAATTAKPLSQAKTRSAA